MNTNPSWDLLGSFLAVMKTGSLSGAARALGTAQPTIRRHVEALEDALGTVLFTRSQTGLSPTRAAEQIVPYAQSMASMAEALVRASSGDAESPVGTVRLACSDIMGTQVLPALLAPLFEIHPGIDVELVASNATENVLRRDVDIAVRMTRPTQSALVARRVARLSIGLFASNDYLRRRPPPATLADLERGHILIGEDRGRSIAEALDGAGADSARLRFAFRSDSDTVQLAAIRAGIGIGVCQTALGQADADLVRVLPELSLDLETWLVTHEDLRDQPRIRAVFDHLASALDTYGRACCSPQDAPLSA